MTTTLELDLGGGLPALLDRPPGARAILALAHGAGAGMRHPFLAGLAARLARNRIAVLRYEFPYMARGAGRPDPPRVILPVVRAAVARAAGEDLPLLAGGKSFGGRMTSTAQAQEPLTGVRGLVFLGFPLHPPGKPGTERADHLRKVGVPMLFLQGTRDAFAKPELLAPVLADLGDRAALRTIEGGDHSFRVPKRSGRDEAAILDELAAAIAAWAEPLVSRPEPAS